MSKALQRSLAGVIDYAGLFPPTRLPMSQALDLFLRYRKGRESWIASRFVCPSARLDELAGLLLAGKDEVRVPISVIGSSGANLDAFRSSLEADAKSMTVFETRCADRAPIEAFEVRLPAYHALEPVMKDLVAFESLDVYLELPWGAEMAEAVVEVAETDWLRAKARTGGIEAAMFPTAHALAGFLRVALDVDLPFKLTAGLHHPYRRQDEATGAWMHGFLNVFAACALHRVHDLSSDELAAILEDSQPGDFLWSDGGLKLRKLACSAYELAEARELFIGFGSCSIEEPLADLAALGLVEECA